jgi:DNA polymerase-3 subunit beta
VTPRAQTKPEQAKERNTEAKKTAEDVKAAPTVTKATHQFQTKKFTLQGLLEKAATVLPVSDPTPQLKNFQIEATKSKDAKKPDQIRVIATDMELSVIASSTAVAVAQSGVVLYPGKRLLDLVEAADSGDLDVKVKDAKVSITVKKASWVLNTPDGSEYPEMPKPLEKNFKEVDRVKFLAALATVRYAATDEVRPTLMMVDIVGGRMRTADGVRYHEVKLADWPDGMDTHIPLPAVDVLVKLLRTTETQTVKVLDDEDYIAFRIGPDIYFANKLSVTFPPVDDMLVKPALTNKHRLAVDRGEFEAAIKRVRVTADPQTSAIVLELESNKVTITSQDAKGNMATEEINASWTDAPRKVSFNHRHLLDLLRAIDVKTCEFRLGNDTKQRRTSLLFMDEDTHSLAVLQQLRPDHVS